MSSRRFSKKTNERRLTLLRNNSSSQKKEIRPFVFLENLRLGKLLLKLTDLYYNYILHSRLWYELRTLRDIIMFTVGSIDQKNISANYIMDSNPLVTYKDLFIFSYNFLKEFMNYFHLPFYDSMTLLRGM